MTSFWCCRSKHTSHHLTLWLYSNWKCGRSFTALSECSFSHRLSSLHSLEWRCCWRNLSCIPADDAMHFSVDSQIWDENRENLVYFKFFNLDFPRVKFAAAAYNFVCELAGWCWQNKLEKTELEIEWKFSYSSLNISVWKDFFFMKNMSFDSTLNGDAVMFGKVIENGQREFSHRLEPWDTANQSNPIRKAQSHVKAASKHPLKPQVGTCIFSVLENVSMPT